MPKLGEKRRTGSNYQVYCACESCNRERWAQMRNGKPVNLHCRKCWSAPHFRISDRVPRNKHKDRLILRQCLDCQKEQWVTRGNGAQANLPQSPRCRSCASRKNTQEYWDRGAVKADEGFKSGRATVALGKLSPYHPMTNKQGLVFNSRLVMAESLNRCLTKTEVVHHRNGNMLDDRIENLELMTNNSHATHHARKELKVRMEKITC